MIANVIRYYCFALFVAQQMFVLPGFKEKGELRAFVYKVKVFFSALILYNVTGPGLLKQYKIKFQRYSIPGAASVKP